jgi:4-hydroxybenzoyl-CoA thioesterase/acyl-CoA thioester hydrolase
MYEFTTRRRVEFADTDMGGIAHFSRYFVFMETAEHEFLEALGTRVALEIDGRRIAWPRVAASCDYKRPARFGDVLEIRVRVRRKGRTSVTYECTFRRDGEMLATGRMTSVCCVLEPSEEVRAIPIPPSIADRLAQSPSGGED